MERRVLCNKIMDVVKRVITDEENLPRTEEDNIGDCLDSLQFVALIVEIENTFDIEIDDEDFEWEKFENINKIADLVEKYVK